MNVGNYIALASVLIALLMATVNINNMSKSSQRNSDKDIKDEERETATILAELKNIQSGVNDIKAEISTIREDTKENTKGVALLEASYKSEHKRIGALEQRVLAVESKT